MAVPALPSSETAGNVYTAAKVNAVYDHLGYWRDDRPMLKVWSERIVGPSTTLPTTTTRAVQLADTSFDDFFYETPLIRVGGWDTVASDPNAIVPETGVYDISAWAVFDASTATPSMRQINLTDGGSNILDTIVRVPGYVSSGIPTSIMTSTLHFFTAGDNLGVRLYQNTGAGLGFEVYLRAIWVGSSTS